jgi:cytochrome P450
MTPDPDREGFGAREMVDQVAIFFLAGHETSAAALGWALYLLATHPEAQARAAAEAQAFVAAPEFGRLGACASPATSSARPSGSIRRCR